jgi:hypothetical protein
LPVSLPDLINKLKGKMNLLKTSGGLIDDIFPEIHGRIFLDKSSQKEPNIV